MSRMAVVLTLLIVGPVWSQHRMQVDPAQVVVEMGQVQGIRVLTSSGGQPWRETSGDDWRTLVEPRELATIEVRGGRITVVPTRAGTGKIHIWHNSGLSWMGLYTVVPIEVREPAPVPVPIPQPTPGGTARFLRLYRFDRELPQALDPAAVTSVAPGETLPLMLVGLSGRGVTVPVQVTIRDDSRACRIIEPREDRFGLHFPTNLAEGQQVELIIGDRLSGQMQTLRFIVQRRETAQMLAVWAKMGLEGDWELLDRGEPLGIRPGQLLILKVVGSARGAQDIPVDATITLPNGGGQVSRISHQTFALITAFEGADIIRLEVAAPGARTRQIELRLGR